MSDYIPMCPCNKIQTHDPDCPMALEIERMREQLNEHRATIFAKEAEAQKWANECELLRRENALLRSENYMLRQRDGMIVVKREGR